MFFFFLDQFCPPDEVQEPFVFSFAVSATAPRCLYRSNTLKKYSKNFQKYSQGPEQRTHGWQTLRYFCVSLLRET